jgi:hypothetical protein
MKHYAREDIEEGMVSYMIRHIPFNMKMQEQTYLIREGIPLTVRRFCSECPEVIAGVLSSSTSLEDVFDGLEAPVLSFCLAQGLPLMEGQVSYLG